ncbi:MAG: S9 family peptidase [Paraglaciecola sp.]|uniref:alpha/beta hydrolase family protein n=1 Tax=Paraglaciecola sp. TaxID=1920173 RepID=UPI003298752F
MFKLLSLLTILLSFSHAQANQKWTAYAQLPIVEQPKISPDGSKIALIYNTPEGPTVSVTEFGKTEFDILASLKLGRDRVDSISWSGNKYIIVSASSPQWYNGEHYRVSRLYAFDVVNKEGIPLTSRRFTSESWYEYITFRLVSLLKHDEEHILVSTYDKYDEGYAVFKVELSSGKYKKIQNNKHNINSWSADVNGVIRLGDAYDKKDNKVTRTIWYRDKAESELIKLHTRVVGIGETFNVIGLTKEGDKAYILSDRETKRESVWLYDIVSGEYESMVYGHPDYDVAGGLRNSEGELIGIYYSDDFSKKHYFNPEDAVIEQNIGKLLKAEHVTIVSRSADKTRILAVKESDNQPALYVHFDFANKKGGAWVSEYPYLSKAKFPHVENYSFTASDGQVLTGYVTFPENTKKPPLIVYPHGGPHSRDYKYFNPQIQYLVSLGYAVLQVNFRGSEGFGSEFEAAGYFQWGKRMQQDVYEAMDWMISTNRVSQNKACIVGASYGGYVALTASFQQPKRFDCIVSIAGISDVKTMVQDDDTFGFYTGHIVDIDDEKDVDQLDEVSAINYIEQIKAPILLIHGSKDTRVDREQSEDFYDSAKRKVDVKYVEIKNGTHFFDDNQSQQTLYSELTRFLEANLQP